MKLFWYLNLNKKRSIILGLLVVCALLFVGSFIFSGEEEYVNGTDVNTNNQDITDLVTKVSQLVYLPENEIPTIATVTDLGALKGQSFFVDAKVGDKVLIYPKAKKAVLYNPKSNKIVTLAPLSVDSNAAPLQY